MSFTKFILLQVIRIMILHAPLLKNQNYLSTIIYTGWIYNDTIQTVGWLLSSLIIIEIIYYFLTKLPNKKNDPFEPQINLTLVRITNNAFYIIEYIALPLQLIWALKDFTKLAKLVKYAKIGFVGLSFGFIFYRDLRLETSFLNLFYKAGKIDRRLGALESFLWVFVFVLMNYDMTQSKLTKVSFLKGLTLLFEIGYLEFLTLIPNRHFFCAQTVQVCSFLILYLNYLGSSFFYFSEGSKLIIFTFLVFPFLIKIYKSRIKKFYDILPFLFAETNKDEIESERSILKFYELLKLGLRSAGSNIDCPLTIKNKEFSLLIAYWSKKHIKECKIINCKCKEKRYYGLVSKESTDSTPYNLQLIFRLLKEKLEKKVYNRGASPSLLLHYNFFLSNFLGKFFQPWIKGKTIPDQLKRKPINQYLLFHAEKQFRKNLSGFPYKLINTPNYNRVIPSFVNEIKPDQGKKKALENANLLLKSSLKERERFRKKSLEFNRILDYIHRVKLLKISMGEYITTRVEITEIMLKRVCVIENLFKQINYGTKLYINTKKLFSELEILSINYLSTYFFQKMVWYKVIEDEIGIKKLRKEWRKRLSKYFETQKIMNQDRILSGYLENKSTVMTFEFYRNELSTINYCSSNSKLIIGHQKNQIMGKNVEIMLPGDLKQVHADFIRTGEEYRQVFNLQHLREIVIEDEKGWLRKIRLKVIFFPCVKKLLTCAFLERSGEDSDFLMVSDKSGIITAISKPCSEFFSISYKQIQNRKLNLSYLSEKFEVLSQALNLKLAMRAESNSLALLFDREDVSEILRLKKKIMQTIFKLENVLYLEYRDPYREVKTRLSEQEMINTFSIKGFSQNNDLNTNLLQRSNGTFGETGIVEGLFRVSVKEKILSTFTISRLFEFTKISKSLSHYKQLCEKLRSSVLTTNLLSTLGVLMSDEVIVPENHLIISVDTSLCMMSKKRRKKMPPNLCYKVKLLEGIKKYQYALYENDSIAYEQHNKENIQLFHKEQKMVGDIFFSELFGSKEEKISLNYLLKENEYKFAKNTIEKSKENHLDGYLGEDLHKGKYKEKLNSKKKYYQMSFNLISRKLKTAELKNGQFLQNTDVEKRIRSAYRLLKKNERVTKLQNRLFKIFLTIVALMLCISIPCAYLYNRVAEQILAKTVLITRLERNRADMLSFISLYQHHFIKINKINPAPNINQKLIQDILQFHRRLENLMNLKTVKLYKETNSKIQEKNALKEDDLNQIFKFHEIDQDSITERILMIKAIIVATMRSLQLGGVELFHSSLENWLGPVPRKYDNLIFSFQKHLHDVIDYQLSVQLFGSFVVYQIIFLLFSTIFWLLNLKKFKKMMKKNQIF